jgi:hypothetical protein
LLLRIADIDRRSIRLSHEAGYIRLYHKAEPLHGWK